MARNAGRRGNAPRWAGRRGPALSRRDLDEDDVRIRPGRRKSRPRSKDRPGHSTAVGARVVAVDRGRYSCLLDDAGSDAGGDGTLSAMRARELGRKAVAVGDRVALVGDLSGGADALARIVRIEPRRSVLRRTADDTDPVERVLVANADQLAVVTATANPEPRPRLIDRCLVAAYDAGMAPLLVITKPDVASPDALLGMYSALDVPYVVVTRGDSLEEVHERLAGRTTVLVGHSGVGKSTLVNALVPGAGRSTGVVNDVTGRGRHTSSSALALPLGDPGSSEDSWVIDTPGVRSFGIAHVEPATILSAFPDLAAGTAECPRGCSHQEPECALPDWVAAGKASPERLESFHRLLASRTAADD